MLKLRNNHKDYFEDQFFVRDALLGIERLIGDSVNEILKLVEYTRPDMGHWIFSECAAINFRSESAFDDDDDDNDDDDDDEGDVDSCGNSNSEEKGDIPSTGTTTGAPGNDRNINANLPSSISDPIQVYDIEEAQMELMTRIFPTFQDLLRQLYEKDSAYGKEVLRDAKLFLKGPPNRPTKDRCSLLPMIFDFIDDTEKYILNSCQAENSSPST